MNYIMPDILKPELKIVFCGTAVGHKTALFRTYYAHPNNSFWKTLADVGLTPHEVAPKDFASITQFGLGLTDLAKSAVGSDHEIHHDQYDIEGFREKILHFKPRTLAFNGKEAAKRYLGRRSVQYGMVDESIGQTLIFVLPSTSAAARRWWNKLVWRELAHIGGYESSSINTFSGAGARERKSKAIGEPDD
jgi:TDG/mug DNA glycosylase family protein